MRRILVLVAAIPAIALIGGPARAQEQPPPTSLTIAIVPMDVARQIASSRGAAYALGVLPDSRDPRLFFNEVVRTAPGRHLGFPSPLGQVLDRADQAVDVDLGPGTGPGGELFALLPPAVERNSYPASGLPTSIFRIVETTDRVYAEQVIDGSAAIVIGVGAKTPFLIAKLGKLGLLRASDVQRAGVLSPYDLSATILHAAGVKVPTSVAGVAATVVRDPKPLEHLDALRARMLRDATWERGLSKTTAGFGIVGGFLCVPLAWRGRRRLALALARGGALVPLGYVAGLFMPTHEWYWHAVPLAAVFAIGFAWPAKDTRRWCAIALLGTAVLIGALEIAATLRPDGEPALSLWGDPLVSWRFFGLRNHLAAFVAGGVVAGTVLLWSSWRVLLVTSLAGAALIGAPRLGANFIGVLTLVFGAVIAGLVLARRRVEVWHLGLAGLLAAGATAGALLSDAGAPVSHGGRAVGTIREGGLGSAWRIFSERARLDYREVTEIGPHAVIGFVLLAIALALVFAWAVRATDGPLASRAAVAGMAAAAFAALFVEDSGFFTGGILALFPGIAYATARAGSAGARGSGSALPTNEPPGDAGDEQNADPDARERE